MVELSRPFPLGLVGTAGRHEVIAATPAECAALAARFGIPAIAALRADLDLSAEADGAVLARGRLRAEVAQLCVVTLEPVEQVVAEDFTLRFLPANREPEDGPEEIDEIPTGPGDVADLGEAVAEQLALALDPYPRAPGASLPEVPGTAGSSPFAALAGLRRPPN
jgi:uncharacterized metal-binding protein YceD (DUF177 family)